MTPFWRPLAKGASSPQCKLDKLLITTISQVLHVPKMKNSLIFVSKLISEGLKVEFDKDGYKVNNVHGIVVVQACREKNLYLLNINV
jgi:hypothetical protein